MPFAVRRQFTRRRLLIVVVIGASWVLYAWLGRATSAGPAEGTAFDGTPSPPARMTLRLATFNIDGGHGTDGKVDLHRTARSLQRLDLIALQEVHADDDRSNQATPLADQMHLASLFAPAERRWGHDSFGNAILTDLPVTAWRRVPIDSRPWAAKRNYVVVDLSWLGRPLHVIATHVDFKANGDEQLTTAIAAFLALPEPAVLLGDLNHPADHPLIRRLATTPGVEEAIGTQYDPIPGRVDWIFLRGLRTVDAGRVDLKASDHPAYWAEVRQITSPASPATRPSSRRSTTPPPFPWPT